MAILEFDAREKGLVTKNEFDRLPSAAGVLKAQDAVAGHFSFLER
jgi:hypothetical protein